VCLVSHEGESAPRPEASTADVQMESVVSSPVSGKVKRVLVVESDSISQGDLVVDITH